MSAFKQLFTRFINDGTAGGMDKQMLKVYVKEAAPHFLVSDGHFFVPAYFSAEAVAGFRAKYPNVNVDALQGKVVTIKKFGLQLRSVDSNAVWTSYANLECQLVVNEFSPDMGATAGNQKHPSNLYRDDEFKTTIQRKRHAIAQAAAAASNPSMANMKASGSVGQGAVTNASDAWSFKGGAKTVSIRKPGSAKKPASAGAAKASGSKGIKKSSGSVKKASGSVSKFTPSNKAKKSVNRKNSVNKPQSKASVTNKTSMAMYAKLTKASKKSKP